MKRYIDFFKSQKTTIEKYCNFLLNSYRKKAFEKFQKLGFSTDLENYQHTDIIELLKENSGIYLDFSETKINPHTIFHCNVPHLISCIQHFVVNGYYLDYEREKNKQNFPKDFFSGSLNVFANKYPDIFQKYYNQQSNYKEDGLSAFNTMFIQDGYVLYIPKNVTIKEPIQLTNIVNGEINSLINKRILIILEQNAQAKLLICDHTTNEHLTSAFIQITEIYLEKQAVLDLYELEESSKKTIRIAHNFVCQSESSKLIMDNIILGNGITKNNYTIDLNGENAETYIYGIAIVDNKQKIDNFTLIRHNASKCCSDELFKYVLDGESSGTFVGKIIVAPKAYKTKACQINRNILNSNTCQMYSKPQLEIYTDDVKCSHGMSTGHLDETALFYMRSRGISDEEARYLLKSAFVTDVLKGIRIEDLKKRLQLLIEKRFRGELIKCQGCI